MLCNKIVKESNRILERFKNYVKSKLIIYVVKNCMSQNINDFKAYILKY